MPDTTPEGKQAEYIRLSCTCFMILHINNCCGSLDDNNFGIWTECGIPNSFANAACVSPDSARMALLFFGGSYQIASLSSGIVKSLHHLMFQKKTHQTHSAKRTWCVLTRTSPALLTNRWFSAETGANKKVPQHMKSRSLFLVQHYYTAFSLFCQQINDFHPLCSPVHDEIFFRTWAES